MQKKYLNVGLFFFCEGFLKNGPCLCGNIILLFRNLLSTNHKVSTLTHSIVKEEAITILKDRLYLLEGERNLGRIYIMLNDDLR